MEIELRHLRLMLAVAQAGSVSGAARLLGLTQPVVTRQVRRVEDKLGFTVFQRGLQGVVCTDHGLEFLNRAREVLTAVGDLADLDSSKTVPLRLAAYCLSAEMMLAAVKDASRYRISGVEADPVTAIAGLRAGRFELFSAVRWPHMAWPDTSGLVCTPILNESMAVLLPASHPCAAEPVVDLADLRKEAWVARPELVTTDVECRKNGFVPKIAYRYTDNNHYLNIVGSGQGVAFCSPATDITDKVVIKPYHAASTIEWIFVQAGEVPSRETVREAAQVGALRYLENMIRLGRANLVQG